MTDKGMTDKEKVDAIRRTLSWFVVTAGACSSDEMRNMLITINQILGGKHVSRES